MYGEFMAFVLDNESLLALRAWAERQGYPGGAVQQGGPDLFAQALGESSPPKMAIIDIDEQADPVAVTSRIASLCSSECRLVVVGSKNDVTFYHHILNAGAVDYLVKPLTPDVLNQALAAALRRPATAPGPKEKEARIVLFLGARGGIGTSTAALNSGWILAHDFKNNVALLDLDLQFGTSALALDLDPGHGLRDIVSAPGRVDALMIASSLVPESEHFSILGAEESIDEVLPVDGGAIHALLKEMKGNFQFIVVDLPRHMIASQKRLLAAAHDIVLLSDLTLAGIRDTLRIQKTLAALGCTARIIIVAARVNASGAGQISREVFEKGIKTTVDFELPEATASLTTAANSGKALGALAARAPLTKALRQIAQTLSDKEAAREKKGASSFWSKIASEMRSKSDKKDLS